MKVARTRAEATARSAPASTSRSRFRARIARDFPLVAGYTVVIPFARAFDPKTGEGWEGSGVAPDIAVPPEKALDEALRLARVPMDIRAALAGLK